MEKKEMEGYQKSEWRSALVNDSFVHEPDYKALVVLNMLNAYSKVCAHV